MREHLNTLVGEKEEIRNNGTTVVVSLYLVHGRKGRAKKKDLASKNLISELSNRTFTNK